MGWTTIKATARKSSSKVTTKKRKSSKKSMGWTLPADMKLKLASSKVANNTSNRSSPKRVAETPAVTETKATKGLDLPSVKSSNNNSNKEMMMSKVSKTTKPESSDTETEFSTDSSSLTELTQEKIAAVPVAVLQY